MSSEDEFDAIPNDFDGFDFDAIPDLAMIPEIASSSISVIPSRPASASSSSHYSYDDDIDESVLVELDAIEGRLNQGIRDTANAPSHPLSYNAALNPTLDPPHAAHMSRFFGIRSDSLPSNLLPIRGHLDISPPKTLPTEKSVDVGIPLHPLRKTESRPIQGPLSTIKGKSKVEPNDGVRQILDSFEDEMTCPICCDIFVAAHIGTCGHSFCGECGWEWISQNKRSPTCAVCRTKLSARSPMIPNFALDNTVNRHLQALATSGREEWQPGGTRINEWNIRKEKWKKDSASRAAEATKRSSTNYRRQTRTDGHPINVDDADDLAAWLVPDDDVDDESYDEAELDSSPVRVRPRQYRSRSNR